MIFRIWSDSTNNLYLDIDKITDDTVSWFDRDGKWVDSPILLDYNNELNYEVIQ